MIQEFATIMHGFFSFSHRGGGGFWLAKLVTFSQLRMPDMTVAFLTLIICLSASVLAGGMEMTRGIKVRREERAGEQYGK